jgi:23S rRNA (guanosine2251-2'-O)-methyltransferase
MARSKHRGSSGGGDKGRPDHRSRPGRQVDRRPENRQTGPKQGQTPRARQEFQHAERQRPSVPHHGKGGPGRLWLYGRHAVESALNNSNRRVRTLICTPDAAETLSGMRRRAGRALPETEIVARADLEAVLPEGAVHQGLAAQCEPLPERALADLLSELDASAPALLVGLDQVTDPQNVGAVLRSTAAFGATGLILTERHAAPEGGALARAASGALDVTPIVRVGNLAKALDELKEAGFWIFGLAGEGKDRLDRVDLPDRLVLLLGAEGSGLRRLTRERCDRLVRLPTGGPIDQLNVSNAAAVALYEVARRRA